MTVALALPRFRERALVGGGWRYEAGAGLPTYFMGACLYVFPNEFRKRRVQLGEVAAAETAGTRPSPCRRQNHVSDPAAIATGNIQVRDHLNGIGPERTQGDRRAATRSATARRRSVELLAEPSVRAVEGVVYRWRTQYKDRMHREVTCQAGADRGQPRAA